MPSSLTGRLITTVVAFVAIVSLLVAVAATLIMRAYLTDRLDSDLDQSLSRFRAQVLDSDRGGPGPGGVPPVPRGNRVGAIQAVVLADGTVRAGVITRDGQLSPPEESSLQRLSSIETSRQPRTVDLGDLGDYRVASIQLSGGARLVQGLPTDDVDSTIHTLVIYEVLLVAVGTAAAAAAGRALVRRQLAPLREVAAAAHEVADLPLATGEVGRTVRVPADLADPATEVGQVGDALNRMLGHVEEALDARHESEQQARQFLADASHELRTPLSTIKGYAELSRRMDDPDDVAGVLAKVEAESNRMTRLVEDMLLLARLDAGRDIEPHPVDLSRLVAEAVHDATVVDPDRVWSVELPPEPVVLAGDEQRLHQLVTNLLRNTTRHTPAGTRVSTSLVVDADQDGAGRVVLEVRDDGPGIPPDLLPTIFDRFTRGDSSRTRESDGDRPDGGRLDGAGLGTALVQAIAHAHGGRATVTSTPGATTFRVVLPA